MPRSETRARTARTWSRRGEFLEADLDVLHLVTAITGIPGGVVRGFALKSLPGAGEAQTTPLFDGSGAPLPIDKNNGTWRDDNSGGQYPDVIWEDSCSRDMLSGWVLGYASAWEAIANDPAFDNADKERLQADAAAIGHGLMEVKDSGYDLEITDPDGRRTYHGILNENSIDRLYVDGAQNGFNGILALGIVAALAYVSEDPALDKYLKQDLIEERGLHLMARDNMLGVDLGVKSNYSSYNMAFIGGWLGVRYLCDEEARSVVRDAVRGRPVRSAKPGPAAGRAKAELLRHDLGGRGVRHQRVCRSGWRGGRGRRRSRSRVTVGIRAAAILRAGAREL